MPPHPILKIGYWNARILVNKLNLFQSIIYSESLMTFYLVTEMRLTSPIFDNQILSFSYIVYPFDCGPSGGEVAIFVSHHSTLNFMPTIVQLNVSLLPIFQFCDNLSLHLPFLVALFCA